MAPETVALAGRLTKLCSIAREGVNCVSTVVVDVSEEIRPQLETTTAVMSAVTNHPSTLRPANRYALVVPTARTLSRVTAGRR